MSEALPIVPDLKGDDLDAWFCSLTTRRLKQMWDRFDDYHVYCDEIHAAMCARGEADYVAV